MAYLAEIAGRTHRVDIVDGGAAPCVTIDGQVVAADLREVSPGTYSVLLDGRSYVVDVSASGNDCTVTIGGKRSRIRLVDERTYRPSRHDPAGTARGRSEVRAMMSGKIVDVLVAVGAAVTTDQGLLIVEAMKMENEIRAPSGGEVKQIPVAVGQAVKTGDLLAVID